MSDDHRRIEPRTALLGRGMVADPDKIEELEARRAQFERATRAKPAKAFGAVMRDNQKKRAKPEEEDEETRKKRLAEEKKRELERKSIRKLMGGGTAHPDHHGGRQVALKG